MQEWSDFTGQFEAREAVEVRPRVSGYLESINFVDGQLVKKGDLLFVIDPRPYRAALARTDELGMRPLAAICHHGLGTLYRATGKVAEAEQHEAMAAAMFQEMDMRPFSGRAAPAVSARASARSRARRRAS